MSKSHKKDCQTLKYIEHFLILRSTITGCLSISAFVSLFCIPVTFNRNTTCNTNSCKKCNTNS